jgi:hypothetical protein
MVLSGSGDGGKTIVGREAAKYAEGEGLAENALRVERTSPELFPGLWIGAPLSLLDLFYL